MSKQIDERVVSMQFDNKHFESNVQTTMSTLDKLKQKLNFTGATKGLDNLGSATKKVDMSGLGNAVETVRTKFSALEVMGVTALANIANSAVNAAKRMVSSLTIEPITDGFKEYEMTLNSVQTTMAATGKTAEQVEEELKKLDEYADKTVYSTADMLSNLPKFTNAGVELETATTAMIGIANATALAGGDASKASIAFYNLGQAIGTGYLTRMDYNSINNAGIATMEWKNQMVDAAIAAGTLTKAGDDMYKAGNKTFTLQQLFIDGLQEQWATTDVMLKVFGDYGDETTAIGEKAYSAAQDIKTFTQMMESAKATAGTGWKDTWQIVFGDLEQAKEFWTGLSKSLNGVIEKMADWRNDLLGGALNTSGWDKMIDKINKAGLSTDKFSELVKSTAKENGIAIDDLIKEYGSLAKVIRAGKLPSNILTKALKKLIGAEKDASGATNEVNKSVEDLDKIVTKVIRGDFGNGEARIKALTEAGYDYATVQNKVNEKLGVSYRHVSKLTEAQAQNADQLVKLSDKQLKSKGYTDEQIEALRELEKAANDSGESIKDLISDMEKPSGKELIFDTFSHLAGEIGKIFNAIKEAWNNTFEGFTSDDLYKIIEKIHDLAKEFEITEEAANNFKRVFEGLFAAFQLTNSIVSMSISGALKILNSVLNLFGTDLLEVAACIADYIVKLRDWVKANTFLIGTWDKIGEVIYTVITGIQACAKAFIALEPVQKLISKIKDKFKEWFGSMKTGFKVNNAIEAFCKILENAFKRLEKWIKSFDGMSFDSIMERLRNSFSNFSNDVLKACPPLQKLVDIIKGSISSIKEWFGSFKESKVATGILNFMSSLFDNAGSRFKEAYEIGKNIIEGLKNGFKDGSMSIGTAIGTIITGLINVVKSLLGIHSPSKVFFAIGGFIIAGLIGGIMNGSFDVKDALGFISDTVTTVFNKLLEFLKDVDLGTAIVAGLGIGTLVMIKKSLDIVKDFASMAKGIGKLTGNIGELVKTVNDRLVGKFKPSKWTIISEAILKVAIAIGILVASVVVMSMIDSKKLWNAVGALAAIIGVVAALAGVMVGLMAATKLVSGSKNVDKIGNMLLKIAGTVVIMAIVAKLISGMSWEDLGKAGAAMAGFGLIIVGLMAATKLISGSKNVDKIGSTLIKIAGAIGIMVLVAKVAASMSVDELHRGVAAITAFSLIMVGLMAATRLLNGSKNVSGIGGTLFKIAAAIGVMILVAKLAASMSNEELIRGGAAIITFGGILVGLMAATKLVSGSKNVDKIGGTLLKAAAAIGVMILVAKIAASMSVEELLKGGIAIAAFSGIIVGLMAATKLVSGSKNVGEIGNTLIKIAGAIAIMMIVAKIAASMTPAQILQGTLAITAIAGLIVGLMAATQLIGKGKNVESIGKNILMMAGAIAAIGLVVALLSVIKPEKLAGATAAIAIVTGMFALLVYSTKNMTQSLGTLIVLTVAIGVLAGALYLVGQLPAESAYSSAIALGSVLLALTGAMLILDNVKVGAKNLLMGILGLLALCVPLLALVGILALMQNIQNAATNALILTGFVTALTLLLIPLTLVGVIYTSTAGMAMTGILGLLALCVPLLAIIGILALMQNIQNAIQNATILSGLMITMTAVLTVLAIIGPLAMIGVTAMAYLTGLIIAIGALAVGIGALMEKCPELQSFLDTGIPLLVQLANGLGQMIGAFVGGIVEQIASSLPSLGLALSQFMINATPFIVGMKMIDPSMLEGVKSLAEAILILCGANMLETITKWIGGESSLGSFGSQLGQLGTDMNAFATNLGSFDESKVTSITCAANAIKAIAEAAKAIPNEGGWAAKIFGDNSIADFGSKLPMLGIQLSMFAVSLGTFDETKANSVTNAANAIKSIAEAASKIPNEGGWAAKIFGDNSIADFGSKLPALGLQLNLFATGLGTFDEATVKTVKCASNVIKVMAEAAKSINGQPDWAKKLFGDNSLATFGGELASFGASLNLFVVNLGTLDDGAVASVNSAVKIIKTMSTLAASDLKNIGKQLPDFGDKIIEFAGDVKEFCETMPGADNLTAAAVDIITKIIEGVDSKKDSVKTKFTDIAKESAQALKDKQKSFYNAGSHLVDGFKNGISENAYKAEAKARAMAKAAAEAAEDELDINSPSKVFRKIGMSVPEGFAMGIDRLGRLVSGSSVSMAELAVSGVSRSIARISDIVNTDIDAQPTIRPVLDLSDVRAGAGSINGLFGMTPSVGVLANVGGISSMMNRNQNGTNDDVISAIKDLKKSISESSGDTYYFGDVRYDDDSSISNAVQTIVRAAKVERRA